VEILGSHFSFVTIFIFLEVYSHFSFSASLLFNGEAKPEKDAVGDWEGMNAVNTFCLKTAQAFTESSWK